MNYTINDLAYYVERLIRPYDATDEINEIYTALHLDLPFEEAGCDALTYHYGNGLYLMYHNKLEDAILHFTSMHELAKQQQNLAMQVKAELLLGITNYQMSGSKVLLEAYPHLLATLKAIKDYDLIVSLTFTILNFYSFELTEMRIYELLAKCINYSKLSKSRKNIIYFLELGGYSKNTLKDAIGALVYYNDALHAAQDYHDEKIQAYIELEIGRCYFDLRRYNQAANIMKDVMELPTYRHLHSKVRFKAELLYSYANLELGYFEEANQMITQLLETEYDDPTAQHYFKASKKAVDAEYQIRTDGNLKEALSGLEEALRIFNDHQDEFKDHSFKNLNLISLGDLHYKKDDFQYALHYYKQVPALSTSSHWHRKDAYERLAITYEALGDFAKAKDMYNKAFNENVAINEINNEKRYNLNFDQFLANTDTFFTQLRQDENIILEEYLDEESLVYNDSLLESYIQFHNETILRKEIALTTIAIQIEAFEEYQAFYGEELTSLLLKTIAKTIQHTFGEYTATVVHSTKEKFYVLLNEVDQEGAQALIDQLLVNVERLAIIHESNPQNDLVTIKVGYSSLNSKAVSDYAKLIDYSTQALQSILSSDQTSVCFTQ